MGREQGENGERMGREGDPVMPRAGPEAEFTNLF
jgi:hypothetical protein